MKLLSLARDLGRRKARERQGLFVIEGVRAVEELLRSSLEVHGALVAPQLLDAPRGAALKSALERANVPIESLDHREFASAAETESPQGVLAIAEIPERSYTQIPDADGPLLVLDGVQDPGNAGTLLRTAAALGARATLALPGTVDLWNAKVVRSSVGAQFTHLAFDTTWDDLAAYLTRTATPLWVAAADGIEIGKLGKLGKLGSLGKFGNVGTPGTPGDSAYPLRVAIALGNEGAGVSDTVSAFAAQRVGIPISGGAESLNVAVAAGILLHQLRPA